MGRLKTTIGIDASPLFRAKRTGIEWYTYHIVGGLLEKQVSDIVVYTDNNTNRPEWARNVKTLSWPSKYLWPELRLSAEMALHPPDTLFVPGRALPLVLPRRTVLTIHDVGFIPYPDERKRLSREYLLATSWMGAHRADDIITISQFSKDEIVRYLKIPPEKITVTYLGYDAGRYVPASNLSQGKPYILFLGRRERRKNIIALVRAYELLSKNLTGDAPTLILVGPPGHHAAQIDRAIQESPVHSSIQIRDWISEDEKIGLLQNALCLVHPSLYEGFGLPVIEAQACGIPVVCSGTTSLPEIAGSGALFFDPTDSQDICRALSQLIHDASVREHLRAEGLKNCARFSWEATVEQTLAVLMKS